ncbi:dehydrodolichyl diphosphate synthase complex subunit Rer2p [[Candida] jaroonii]|uniref:Dehydrodolichyl diphosphate synthase complex subunit Rer2p n=1 Tax=[Candida] jaroonii TaxID=467808 RepID=A0ACA9Y4Y4_9ASCO|nr:dehydrodolichyl diphosphate synthase complex subunit Rer2p [[Candida] jaroonii]
MSVVSINEFISLLANFPIFAYLFSFVQDIIISILKTGPIPKHVAMIMDGNRTFAKKRNLSLKQGHTAGAESLVKVLDTCFRLGVKVVTIYAFSIENFNRSKEEIDTLFGLLRDRLKLLAENENSYSRVNMIKIRIIGNKSMIPEDILQDLEKIEDKTNLETSEKILNVCFPYTSRDDIVHSIKQTSHQRMNGLINKDSITLDYVTDNMYFGPDSLPLDIMIRTSGQTRLSDFMLWQCNYNCTIEFVDTLWPDFKFLSLIMILMKWGYYKTLEMESEMNKLNEKDEKEFVDILKELPPHPPHKSVTDRK